MKKLFSLVLLLVSALVLFGCDDNEQTKEPTPQEHVHEFSTTYSFDDNNHWYDCSCGETSGVSSHTWDNGVVVKEATEKSPGEMKYTCTVCGKTKSAEISKLEHVHSFEETVTAIAPTCTTDGVVAHKYCSSCQKYFNEEMVEISENDLTIPALGHSFEKVAYKAPTCTEAGNVAHNKCSRCDEKYALEDKTITLTAGKGWDDSLAPYCTEGGANDLFVVSDGLNAALKIKTVNVYPAFNQFKKLVPGSLNVVGTTYRLLIDVKLGSNVAIPTSKLDIQYFYPTAGGIGNVIISDGRQLQTVGAVNSNEWTTLEYEFTIGQGALTDWANITFIYWCEGNLDDSNYVLVDNIRVVASDDQTNTNLDTIGNGDFDGYFETVKLEDASIPAAHNLGSLIAEKPATCTADGLSAHYTCLSCDKYFNEQKEEVSLESLVIAATGNEHSLGEWVAEVPASCGVAGTKGHKQCSVCEAYFDAEGNQLDSLVIEALSHNLEVVAYSAPTCTEAGNVAHKKCSLCGETYTLEDKTITLAAGQSWDTSLAPYCTEGSGNDLYVVNDGLNAALKIKTVNVYPAFNQFKKLVPGSLNVVGTTYRLLIDVKLGSNVAVPTSKLDIQYFYPTATGIGNVIISDGRQLQAVGAVNSNGWTTLEYQFTIGEGALMDWANITFIYWCEGALDENNYALVDNIRVVASDDQTNTNLDTIGNGDFEIYFELVKLDSVSIPAAHNYGQLVEKVDATCTGNGVEAHYQCQGCNKYFNESKEEVSYEDLLIVATGNEHSFGEWVAEVPASCGVEGTKGHKQCSVCEAYFDAEGNQLDSLVIEALSHNLVDVSYVAPTCDEAGNVAHKKCSLCGETYALEDKTITLAADKSWDASLAPYCTEGSGNDFYIINDGVNAALKIKTVNPWPAFTQFKKLVPGSLNVVGTTYRLLIDVKLGSNVAIPTSKLDIQYFYPSTSGIGSVIISDGRQLQNVGSVNSNGWTTLEYEFTIGEGALTDWANITFIYWCEGALDENNYVLVDNIRVVASDDQTNTNLDTIGNGDFEIYFELVKLESVVIPAAHNLSSLVVEKPATCTEDGLKAHYHCAACNKYYNEEKEEVAYEDLVIASPKTEHVLELVEAKAPTTEETGCIAHYNCTVCGANYVYEDKTITLAADKSWDASLAPYCTEGSGNDFYIINDGVNAALKIKTVNPWPVFTQFKKLVPGSLNVSGTTYRLLIDVKLGSNAAVPTSKLDIQYFYHSTSGIGSVIISDGRQLQNVGAVNSNGWTTLEYQFTIGEGALMDWANITFIYWCEGALDENNYVLVDNIRVVASDDQTNVNLDTIGNGDFEIYFEMVALPEEAVILSKSTN